MSSSEIINSEYIPDDHHVFRNVNYAQIKKWETKRRPNETDFMLRENEDGLSVNWEKYCSLNEVFILLGLQKRKDGITYREPKEFRVIKFNVGALRGIKLLYGQIVDVIHDPQQGNKGHSLVHYEDEEEIRVKLCEMVESFEQPLISPNFDEVEFELKQRRINV